MGNTPSNLPPRQRASREPLPLVAELSQDEIYTAPGGFETPKTQISDTESQPAAELVHPLIETKEEKPHEAVADDLENGRQRPRHTLNSQTLYVVSNVKSGAAIDISGGDGRSIIGFPLHGGSNQQWQLVQLGDGNAIFNPSSGNYLQIGFDAEGIRLVASRFPMTWKVQEEESADIQYRILWHTGELSLHVEDETPGRMVQLKHTNLGDESQLWKFAPCGTVDCKPDPIETRQSLPPQVVDTLVVLDGQSKTIRTTTTITTITTVV